jgi:small subunit ribosomal protein S18
MAKKLFVSNLDFEVTAEQLKELFNDIGAPTSIVVATDRETKRSKGFAFIEMNSDELADQAIEKLSGKVLNGRPIKVAADRGKTAPSIPGVEGSSDNKRPEFLPAVQRAQLFKRRKKLDPFMADPTKTIDYKDVTVLTKFLSERGKLYSRRITGLSAYNQRKVAKAIKRAQCAGLMPFTTI